MACENHNITFLIHSGLVRSTLEQILVLAAPIKKEVALLQAARRKENDQRSTRHDLQRKIERTGLFSLKEMMEEEM
ncbi:hypothetical protein llap_14967 [Limosa lapponica baueri]|uniref:Uncharacterized protein n=1 Tax=Limosa lapponica baueri TaxID=1758121 RepID=A0A2I0TLP0_LIMLA|nr:hypothetical protein llap_14967 [Limosa lapponica baueri]